MLPITSVVGGNTNLNSQLIDDRRLKFGHNFAWNGQIVLGEFQDIYDALVTNPQARTFTLGRTSQQRYRLPKGKDGRDLYIISQSQKGAGGDEELRRMLEKYIIGDAALERQNDSTVKILFDQLVKDYKTFTSKSADGKLVTDDEFFNVVWPKFNTQYMHYVFFGLNPYDEETTNYLQGLYVARVFVLYYVKFVGFLLGLQNDIKSDIEKVGKIYADSPALSKFTPEGPAFYSKDEIAQAMIPIFAIAAMNGPESLTWTCLGKKPLDEFTPKPGTSKIDVTEFWDKIDLSSKEQVEQYIYECGRLCMPVNCSHRVATEEFTAKICGKERTFPAGTVINIPTGLAMVNEDFWGMDTYDFKLDRKNGCPFSMIFSSVGPETNGKVCPGKPHALNLISDIVVEFGKVRRELLH